MDHNQQEQIALHRWAVIAEAAGDKLTARERGALVRQIAARAHPHPDGSSRTYSRGTHRPVAAGLAQGRAGGTQASGAGGHRRGARPPGAVRRGRGAAAGAARPLGRADRLDLVSPARDHRLGADGPRPAAPRRAAPRGAGRRAEGLRPVRGRARRTSGGSPTCWSARGCRGRAGTGRCGPGCSSSSMIIPGCWSTAGSTAGRTPGPARSCCAGRSPAAACRRCSMLTTERLFRMRGWPAPAACWASGWCIRNPTRRKGGGNRRG